MSQEDILFIVAALTLIVSTIGARYSYRGDRRKSGIDILGSYSVVSTIEAEDCYVGEVILQNAKDREAVVFGIYLELGHGYYVEVETFEKPMVLRPYGVYRKKYQTVDFYAVSDNRAHLNSMLRRRRTRRRLILSTGEGKYRIRERIGRWNPIVDMFNNHYTGVFRPLRAEYNGEIYGSRTRYVVKLTNSQGKKESFPIVRGFTERRIFRDFDLTADSLESKETLELFLRERMDAGDLPWLDVSVIDLESWRKSVYRQYKTEGFEATPLGWFRYHVVGKVTTLWRDFMLRRSNRRRSRNRERKNKNGVG